MKRQYTIEFKIDAAKLVEDQGYSVPETSERLGVPSANITRWVRQYRQGKLLPGHKQAQPTEQEAELKRLRAQVKQLEMEVDILKKASAYFAKNQK
ncbi:MAG: transposase [Trueperaceae bacterium]|nr:transposase [Trueperaceae bacterium]